MAHRSTLAWAGLIEYNGISLNSVKGESNSNLGYGIYRIPGSLNGTWFFGAASGATTDNVLSESNGGTKQSKLVSYYNETNHSYTTRTNYLDYQMDTIIRNEMFQKTKILKQKSKKAYTVPAIIEEMEGVYIIRDSKNKYIMRYGLTAKQKLILNQFSIDEKQVKQYIKDLNDRLV